MNHSELNLLIVKGNPLAALKLEQQIKKIGYKFTKIVDNLTDALQSVEQSEIDLVILDVELKGTLDGITLAKFLNKKNKPFLCVTNAKHLALYQKIKPFKPVAYLLESVKNSTLESILSNINSSIFNAKKQGMQAALKASIADTFFIKQNNVLKKIPYDDVLWIKTEGNYSIIYTTNKRYILKLSLKKVLVQLPKSHFIQIQRAFIVALSKIEDIDTTTNEVIINEEKLPLGRNYRDELLGRLQILK